MRNEFAKVSDPNSFVTCPGDRYHVVYTPKVCDDGTIELVESGVDDIQEMIDSWRESTDMSWIVQRIKEGDMSVLNQSTPMYGDFTKFPKTYAEALQMVIDAERKFNDLPLSIRNQYENDYMRWFAQAGSESWMKSMEPVLFKDSVVSETEVEVNSDES